MANVQRCISESPEKIIALLCYYDYSDQYDHYGLGEVHL